jgi:hypothetical protein
MPAGRRDGASIKGEICTSNGSDFQAIWQGSLRNISQRGTVYILFMYILFNNEQSASVTTRFDNTVNTRSTSRLLY